MTVELELNSSQAEVIIEALKDLEMYYADKANDAYDRNKDENLMEDYYWKKASEVENVRLHVEAETACIRSDE